MCRNSSAEVALDLVRANFFFSSNWRFRFASYQVQEDQPPYLPEVPKEIKLDCLLAQFNLFDALQASHEVWAANKGNPESEHLQREIIELIGQM